MIKIKREELYEKVWSQPITHIAEEYGVSDSAIIKICKKMNVPRPIAGHWAKIKAGRSIKRTRLPKTSKSGIETYELIGMPSKKSKKDSTFHPLVQYEMATENKITISNDESIRHPLYLRNKKSFNNAKANEKHILIPKANIHFNLKVTDNTLSRALSIMDSLAKVFDQRGWKLECIRDAALTMQVIILDEKIEFSIDERIRQVDHVLTEKELLEKKLHRYSWTPRWDYVPSEQLSLKITSKEWLIDRHTWKDGKIQRVEDCLNKFCIAAIELAEAIKIDRAEKRAYKIKQKEESVQREELRTLRDAEIDKRKIFESQAEAWKKAEDLREFINAVTNLDIKTLFIGENEINKEAWVEWAKNYATHIDPLLEAIPTIVEETDGMFWYR